MSKKAFSNKGQSYYYLGKPFANVAVIGVIEPFVTRVTKMDATVKHSEDILMPYFLSKKIRR